MHKITAETVCGDFSVLEVWNMRLRSYRPEDCVELAKLFYDTVHAVNVRDYSEEQLNAWAAGCVDMDRWSRSYLTTRTIIAEEKGQIIGFGNMDESGYLDMLYVHKDHQRKGVATAICDDLESNSASKIFTTHASITAQPFFAQRGYRTLHPNDVERQGVHLTNYTMIKTMQ